mmetsp:Transcript_29403/g.63929  ORF Transcript_29403/g.63929 Transcript_29403/m.63929 type:complete len:204 (-) Transcript_29403:249-860(-)
MQPENTRTIIAPVKRRTGKASRALVKASSRSKKLSKPRSSFKSLSTGVEQLRISARTFSLSSQSRCNRKAIRRNSGTVAAAMSTRLWPKQKKALRLGQTRKRRSVSATKVASKTNSTADVNSQARVPFSTVCIMLHPAPATIQKHQARKRRNALGKDSGSSNTFQIWTASLPRSRGLSTCSLSSSLKREDCLPQTWTVREKVR